MRRKRTRIALGIAAVLGIGALVWSTVGVSTLVKYPTDMDVWTHYQGTFTVYVDPTTAAPLATPMQVPLEVDRHIQALGDQSDGERVVVAETIEEHAGSLVNTTQRNQYVMDRQTLRNIADPRAFAFDPANVVNRAAAYRLNLPFDTSGSASYRIYKNEIGDTYVLSPDSQQPTVHEDGLDLARFDVASPEKPLTPAYLAELSKSVPLPASLTLTQLEPQLQQLGVDVTGLLGAMAPYLSADDTATLLQIAAKPIPLQYLLSFGGTAAVEPTTGAEVHVAVDETVSAKPQLTDLATLQTMLQRYPGLPETAAAKAALDRLAGMPSVRLFAYHYDQTPASVAEIAHKVSSMRTQIRIVKLYVPWTLLVLALTALTFGLLTWWHDRNAGLDVRHHAPPAEHLEQETATTAGGSR